MKRLFLFLVATIASAASHDWAAVERLKPGTEVIVDTTRGTGTISITVAFRQLFAASKPNPAEPLQ